MGFRDTGFRVQGPSSQGTVGGAIPTRIKQDQVDNQLNIRWKLDVYMGTVLRKHASDKIKKNVCSPTLCPSKYTPPPP